MKGKRLCLLALVLALALMMPVCLSAAMAEEVTASRTLEFGMTGGDVLEAQTRLNYYGFYNNTLDGVFGNGVLTAVKQFQRKNGLTVDGKIGPATWALLNSDTALGKEDAAVSNTLQSGAVGEAVKELQRQLRETYYYAGKITGEYDANVTRAVKWFQTARPARRPRARSTTGRHPFSTAAFPAAACRRAPGDMTFMYCSRSWQASIT